MRSTPTVFATRRTVGAAAAVGVAFVVAACSGDGTTASSTPSDGAGLGSTSAPPSSATPTGPSHSTVTGSAPTSSTSRPSIVGTRCDVVRGPDGGMRIVTFSGADCATAMPIAQDYGARLRTGQPQQETDINGWKCGPSQTTGLLARCAKGDASFGFMPE